MRFHNEAMFTATHWPSSFVRVCVCVCVFCRSLFLLPLFFLLCPVFCALLSLLPSPPLPPLQCMISAASNHTPLHLPAHLHTNPARCACVLFLFVFLVWMFDCVSVWRACPVLLTFVGVFAYTCVCVCVLGGALLLLFLPVLPLSLNTPGSRASTASAAAVLSSSSSSSRPRHHKSLSSSNHPCPSDLHAPRPRQVSHTLFVFHTHTPLCSDHHLSCNGHKRKRRDEDGIK